MNENIQAIFDRIQLTICPTFEMTTGIERMQGRITLDEFTELLKAFNAVPKWQPTDTAPFNKDVLVYWTQVALDEDGDLTDEIVGGYQIVSRRSGAHWDEPDNIACHGSHLGDDWEWALAPSYWKPLDADPISDAENSTEPAITA